MGKQKSNLSLLLYVLFCIDFSTIYAQSKVSQSDVGVSRNVSATQYSPSGEAVVIITITINKNATRGHALLEEDFSSDLEATVVKNGGAVFKTKNGEADFEWTNIPPDKAVTVSYQLDAAKKTGDDQAVFGHLTYQNQTYTIYPSSFSLKILAGTPKPKIIPKPPVTIKSGNTNPPNPNPSPALPGDLVYRIQIAAVPDKAKVPELLKQYQITEQPYLETVNSSTIRLMIGNYPTLNLAKNRVDELKNKGLAGAFVVPYYKGKRTNLQEAAMHTRQ